MIVVAAWLHDAAPTHKGQVTQKEKRHVYSHFDEKKEPMEFKAWQRSLRVEEDHIPDRRGGRHAALATSGGII